MYRDNYDITFGAGIGNRDGHIVTIGIGDQAYCYKWKPMGAFDCVFTTRYWKHL